MTTNDIQDLFQAQRRLLRKLQGQAAVRPKLGPEDRERLIAHFKTELEELHQEKERSIRRLDEEIRHYEELLARVERMGGKEQQVQQSQPKEQAPGRQPPGTTPEG